MEARVHLKHIVRAVVMLLIHIALNQACQLLVSNHAQRRVLFYVYLRLSLQLRSPPEIRSLQERLLRGLEHERIVQRLEKVLTLAEIVNSLLGFDQLAVQVSVINGLVPRNCQLHALVELGLVQDGVEVNLGALYFSWPLGYR